MKNVEPISPMLRMAMSGVSRRVGQGFNCPMASPMSNAINKAMAPRRKIA